jgi:hypothetical protein
VLKKNITNTILHLFLRQEPHYKIIKKKLKFVKEQRVDGSWYKGFFNPMYLRCTLMGFERNYQIKIPSKQLNIRNYSSIRLTPQEV